MRGWVGNERQLLMYWLGQQHQHDIMVTCLPSSPTGGDVANYVALSIVDLNAHYFIELAVSLPAFF